MVISLTEFEPVIGMEMHTELGTQSKIFCGCSTAFGAEPNTQTCPVCLGLPGSLPVLNRQVVEYGLRAALALHCKVNAPCIMERKNYYYPDLPKAYQISQRMLPLGAEGYVEIPGDGGTKRVGITDAHIEEDTGKSLHGSLAGDPDSSLIDYNRSGIPLLEIISEPDMNSVEDAEAYMETMRSIMLYLEVSDCKMEHGRMRFEASVSLRPKGTTKLGTRVEIKNLNSFRAVTHSLLSEIDRQRKLLGAGVEIVQETMLWDEERGVTEPMRSKEFAHDYRYFPEPDLVPIVIDDAWINRARAVLPELPRARRQRFVREFSLPEYDATVLTSAKASADFFETATGLYDSPKVISNWMMGDFAALLNADGREIQDSSVTPKRLTDMLKMIDGEIISGKIAKTVFEEMYRTGRAPGEIVKEKGLVQISDESAVELIVDEVIAENPDAVENFRGGNEKSIGFLVGQVMKKSRGKANPQLVNDLLKRRMG
ncbi:MAG: glutaminyl-tRNA synthase (glutamine-hydrolyzing) subunit B [Armatimonadetes bacterium CG2_30_59_28]|nr:Asp-tRNA(Asn)/Glu-tRNA(Gln) amidotransferase subunit GatB [Armatimonadota bacterium]OIO97464.1 MAG: glutaminyl-tRNA synthase (glutamine-hydrolyzing) subunit B [Armatimonadetes bacterium CG2_30_59_28]PIU62622.1 MAG: Asp-tRNA(Asn)/Glu-tRNA(Gln) amidotransferase GatCAB subunit B [Armatimonadetes bacterium CG07_land_8_20_14_0_80_59_28]PIX40460.1 MAG: Asp-tRNA(Asn)/Glu-tRNA(Gln) amidotransferase GatCAB subunit B [Armatimonadetes bacterium CG_4_8_14_3_um_filter_58_9]PIY47478.1 MAG: Asp-tRNA(Asn)/G